MDSKNVFALPHGVTIRAGGARVEIRVGERLMFDLKACCLASVLGQNDDDSDIHSSAVTASQEGDCKVLSWIARSSCWQRKEYRLEARAGSVVLRTRVHGSGQLGRVRWFAGTGLDRSRYEASRYLVPTADPSSPLLPGHHSTAQDGVIFLGYLVPSMLAFSYSLGTEPWVALGLAPRPGQYNFDTLVSRFSQGSNGLDPFYLEADFLGYTKVDGTYDLPAIVITSGQSDFDSLAAQREALIAHEGCARGDWSKPPRWWMGPLFCGWGEQCIINRADPLGQATQANYTRMSDRLDELGLKPSAIILDDKWMGEYGPGLPDSVKWPDMRGFVDREHAKGRRVILWFKAWNSEGLPFEECVTLWHQPHGADPTNEAYRHRIQKMMHTLLSPDEGCYNCDGFKVDFANVMPLGPDLQITKPNCYGIELLKEWFTLFYNSAKAVKTDCLVNTSCCHPYFSEVTDQARLHDYNAKMRAAWEVRSHRTRLFKAALGDISIDTDGIYSSRDEIMDYLCRSHELGVPGLYNVSVDADHPLTDDDFRKVARVWDEYSRRMDQQIVG